MTSISKRIQEKSNYFSWKEIILISNSQRIINSQIILKLLGFGTSNCIEHAVGKKRGNKENEAGGMYNQFSASNYIMKAS